jgi:hypothetical protein
MSKLYRVAIGAFAVALIASGVQADGPDISAQRLLESWKGEDPGLRMVAEVIAGAFASGFSWGWDRCGKAGLLFFAGSQRGSNHERLRGVLERSSEDGR